MAVVDRGYRGAKHYVEVDVLLPSAPLKRDSAAQRAQKRKLCQKRAAIEPIIGHLKHDYNLSGNWLRGSEGDAINLLLAACAWNLKKWMTAFFLFEFQGRVWALVIDIKPDHSFETVLSMMWFRETE